MKWRVATGSDRRLRSRTTGFRGSCLGRQGAQDSQAETGVFYVTSIIRTNFDVSFSRKKHQFGLVCRCCLGRPNGWDGASCVFVSLSSLVFFQILVLTASASLQVFLRDPSGLSRPLSTEGRPTTQDPDPADARGQHGGRADKHRALGLLQPLVCGTHVHGRGNLQPFISVAYIYNVMLLRGFQTKKKYTFQNW